MKENILIDIHCHGLYGVDDGAQTYEESQAMVRAAAAEGVGRLIYTFHYIPGIDFGVLETAKKHLAELQKWAAQEMPDMELFLGNEIYYDSSTIRGLHGGSILTLADTSYALLEFSYHSEAESIIAGARELISSGYRPIIAHVERYGKLVRNGKAIEQLRSMGAYIQVNSRSFMGGRFNATTRWVTRLLESGCVDFVADDFHNLEERKPLMGTVYEKLSKKTDPDIMYRVFIENPQRLLADRSI